MAMPPWLRIRSLRRSASANAIIILVAMACGAAIGWSIRAWRQHAVAAAPQMSEGEGNLPRGMVWIPGGEFLMGSESSFAKPNEAPVHKVRIRGFWMDRTPVTNAQFATFVTASGYVTTAEHAPNWETLKVQLPPGTAKPADDDLVPGGMVFVGTDGPADHSDYTQWWRYVAGANWRHPQGPGSSIAGKDDYPVVQVSYADALAYARWI